MAIVIFWNRNLRRHRNVGWRVNFEGFEAPFVKFQCETTFLGPDYTFLNHVTQTRHPEKRVENDTCNSVSFVKHQLYFYIPSQIPPYRVVPPHSTTGPNQPSSARKRKNDEAELSHECSTSRLRMSLPTTTQFLR
jgi:hypothetical protein